MAPSLSVGLIGCGHAAEMHLRAIRSLPRVTVEVVADVDEAARRRIAHAAGDVEAVATADALLARPVRAVAVLTPPALHFEIAMAALDAGKDVLLERPMTCDLDQADRLQARAAACGRTVMVGYNLRFHRHVLALRRHVAEGMLGRLQLLRTTATSTHSRGRRLAPYCRERRLGGGVLLDLGVAHFDLWRFLVGDEVEEVTAFTRADDGDDMTAGVLGRMTSGVLVSSVFSNRAAEQHAIEILGERGGLTASLYRSDGLRFAASGSFAGSASRRLRDVLAPLAALPSTLATRRHGGVYLASYRSLWDRFVACLLEGAPPSSTLEDGRRSLDVALAAIRSADEGRSVRVGDAARSRHG